MLSPPSIEIDTCAFLWLREMGELNRQGLRLLVEEGRANPEIKAINVAGVTLEGHPVKPTGHVFEITWSSYIAYCVRNESYCAVPADEDLAVGKRFRIYRRSHFLNFISCTTIACPDYPGPFVHFSVCCEDHVIDVISVDKPEIRREG